MPRYARVSNESYESAANAGASELNRIRDESIQAENQKRIAAYERMHLELERAKQERQMAHDQAKTEQRIKYEYMMADAAKKLYAIDPSDPRATEKVGAVVSEFPQLLHNEPGLPSLKSDVQHYQSLIETGRRQGVGIDAKQEAADLRNQNAQEAAKLRNQHAIELKQLSEQHAKALEPLKMATQVRGQLSTHQRQLDDAQKVIDRIEKTTADENDPITSTGIFTDDNGKKRFGFANVLKEKSPLVTPLQEERYNNYKAALSRRSDFQTKVEQSNAKLDQLLSGDAPPAAPGVAAAPALATEGDRPPVAAETEPTSDEVAPSAVVPANPNLAPASPVAPAPPVAAVPAPVAPPTADVVAPAAIPHPYEGKRVLQKSTGKYGTFTNGQFVAE